MTTYRRLRTLFRSITASSLATGAAGCGWVGPSDPLTPYDRSEFAVNACAFDNLHPAEGVDFVGRRFIPGPGILPVDTTLYGSACSTATDANACFDALAALPADVGFSDGFSNTIEQYVFNRGDEVSAATNLDELIDVLGAIDTAAEARLVVEHSLDLYVDCSGNNARFPDGGTELLVTDGGGCGEGNDRHESIVFVDADGTAEVVDTRVVERGDPNCVIGRLTDGAEPRPSCAPRTVGEHLARMASLEEAAVVAFARLAAEMRSFGAPEALVAQALDAAGDEARHVRMVAAEARRFGASVAPVATERLPLRGRLEVALENAREGMVRETYGALAATYHAGAAQDEALGRMFARIAEDETRHASLAIDFGRWLEATLDETERAEVFRAREDAARTLADDVAVELAPEVHATLGWPTPAIARELVADAFPAAWG